MSNWCGGLCEEDELSYEELMYIKQCYADAIQDEDRAMSSPYLIEG